MRLDKFLADAFVGTRSEVKKVIKGGAVQVNGIVAKNPDMKIDENEDEVMYQGRIVVYEKYRYYILNKPGGCVSATRDRLSPTVVSFLEGEETDDLFPVGRLDKDTEGLLLITNDGDLAHSLLSPRKHVDKVYYAHVDKRLSDPEEDKFRTGVNIGDEDVTLPAGLIYEGEKDNLHIYRVVIREGRYHQVKRMFEAFGSEVKYLKRVRMGNLSLPDDLECGHYIKLDENYIKDIFGIKG